MTEKGNGPRGFRLEFSLCESEGATTLYSSHKKKVLTLVNHVTFDTRLARLALLGTASPYTHSLSLLHTNSTSTTNNRRSSVAAHTVKLRYA